MDYYTRKDKTIEWIEGILKEAARQEKELRIKEILGNAPPQFYQKRLILERIDLAVNKGKFYRDEDILIPSRYGHLIATHQDEKARQVEMLVEKFAQDNEIEKNATNRDESK